MPSWVKWVISVLLVVGAGVALILFKMSKSKAVGQLAVDAIEAAHKPQIDRLNSKIEELSKDVTSNAANIFKASDEVRARKADLKAVYEHTGLSEAEIMTRLGKLKV